MKSRLSAERKAVQLALDACLAESLGATLTLGTSDELGGLEVTVTFPVSQSAT